MPFFKHIKVAADLPAEGSHYEQANCDFKTWYELDRRYEMAKDVAAFANAMGGTLVIGAVENEERLVKYQPKTQAEADQLRKVFNEVIKDRCIPSPTIEPIVLAKDGGHVLVVNVHGLPGQPVGIKITPQKEHERERVGDAFVFPARRQTGTQFLNPKELSTLMMPELRVRALQLASIPDTEREVTIMWMRVASSDKRLVHLVDVDDQAVTALFSINEMGTVSSFSVPLDQIASVRSTPDGPYRRWVVDVKGVLMKDTVTGQFHWQPHYR